MRVNPAELLDSGNDADEPGRIHLKATVHAISCPKARRDPLTGVG